MKNGKPLWLAIATVLMTIGLVSCGGGGDSSDPSSDSSSDSSGSDSDSSGTGGGGSDDDTSVPVTSSELLDPTPGNDDNFGADVLILTNGNIVVTDPGDSSVASNNGAVHLYSGITRSLIASIYGDQSGDSIGVGGLTAVGNNFTITSDRDNNGVVSNAGSVRLVDGSSGTQISALFGDDNDDQLGSSGVSPLANGNYVVSSGFDDYVNFQNAGSVRLMNGATGAEISVLYGGQRETLGARGVTTLPNDNFVVQSSIYTSGFNSYAGSVRLLSGVSGETINLLAGTSANAMLGSSGVTALNNSNFVVESSDDTDGSGEIGGSVRLLDGVTGEQINALFGDGSGDFFLTEVIALNNDNYVILAPSDTRGTFFDAEYVQAAGSIRLMDGSTGEEQNVFYGDQRDDNLGFRSRFFGTSGNAGAALDNGNFIVASSMDDNDLLADVGSVRLFDGLSGEQISVIYGDQERDQLGSEGVTALRNNRYVIASNFDDNGSVESAGSVRLMDGTSGVAIGSPIFGDQLEDRLASDPHSIVPLANGNFVIASPEDGDAATANAGSVRLIDAQTGEQISVLVGDQASDRLGSDLLRGGAGVTALANSNYVILSRFDDDSSTSTINAGSVRLMDGVDGTQLSVVVGESSSDLSSGAIDPSIIGAEDGSYFLIAAPLWDNHGRDNSGMVRIVTP